jgi:hypothetical protein
MRIKALMAEPGHKLSHQTIANIGERAAGGGRMSGPAWEAVNLVPAITG